VIKAQSSAAEGLEFKFWADEIQNVASGSPPYAPTRFYAAELPWRYVM